MSTIVLCATYTHSVFRGEGRSSGPELDMMPLGEGANVRLLISQCGDLLSLHSSAQTFSPVSVRLSCVVAALVVMSWYQSRPGPYTGGSSPHTAPCWGLTRQAGEARGETLLSISPILLQPTA